MTDLERRGLLGDKQAQEECTRRLIALSCPCCKGKADYWENSYLHKGYAGCTDCGLIIEDSSKEKALSFWNTRPAPPIGRCKDCTNWFGNPGDEYAPCKDCDGVMEADNFCRNFEPREVRNNG